MGQRTSRSRAARLPGPVQTGSTAGGRGQSPAAPPPAVPTRDQVAAAHAEAVQATLEVGGGEPPVLTQALARSGTLTGGMLDGLRAMLLLRVDKPLVKLELTLLVTLLAQPGVQQALRDLDLAPALHEFTERFRQHTVGTLRQELRTCVFHSAWQQPTDAGEATAAPPASAPATRGNSVAQELGLAPHAGDAAAYKAGAGRPPAGDVAAAPQTAAVPAPPTVGPPVYPTTIPYPPPIRPAYLMPAARQ